MLLRPTVPSLLQGDIKPHNVLVTGLGQEFLFKIIDYACYKYKNANQTTNDARIFGTRVDVGNYLDPTQFNFIL